MEYNISRNYFAFTTNIFESQIKANFSDDQVVCETTWKPWVPSEGPKSSSPSSWGWATRRVFGGTLVSAANETPGPMTQPR